MRLDGSDEVLDDLNVLSAQRLLLDLAGLVERQMKVVDVIGLRVVYACVVRSQSLRTDAPEGRVGRVTLTPQ